MKHLILYLCVICALCGQIQAANEIRAFVPGATTCFSVVREIDGDVFYPATNVFEVWGTGARTANDYDIAMVSKSGGMFVGVMDTDISAGYYHLVTHQQAGANPADTDPAVWQEYGYWSGTVWQPYTLKTIEDVITDANDNIESYVADLQTAMDANFVTLITAMDANFAAIDVPTTEEIRIEMDANSTDFNTIITNTGTTIPTLIIDANNNIESYIVALNDFDPVNDTVAHVTLVDTTTTNTDMRGTDNANIIVPDAAGIAASLHTITNGKIDALNNLSNAEAQTAATAALNAYDPPTKVEMDDALSGITVDNDAIAAAVWSYAVEGAYIAQDYMRLFASVLFGKTSGGGTTSIKYRDMADTKNRITGTVDSKGHRTSVTKDPD